MRALNKHVITIWTETDIADGYDIAFIAQEAIDGEAYCASHVVKEVENPEADPDWDGTEFFGADEDDEEEEDL